MMRRIKRSTAILLALALSGCWTPVATPANPPAAPAAPAASAEQTGITLPKGGRKLETEQVRMRDGARLNADVYLPAEDGKFPVVLVRTPYKTEIGRKPTFFNELIAQGYAVMQEHERGRFLSEGEMRMLGRADEDGWDTLEWITKQGWSNGKVATYGCSSSAENQLKLASLNHPAHKAMIAYSAGVGVAEAGPFTEQGNFWRGGVWQQGWADYFYSAMPLAWAQLPPELSDEDRKALVRANVQERGSVAIPVERFNETRMHLPMIDMGKASKAPDTEIEEYLKRGPKNPEWANDRVVNSDVIKVPGLWAEALYDISSRSTVAFFEKTRAENPAGNQNIIITNGPHCGYGRETADFKIGDRPLGDARFDYNARQIAWLNHWMKDDKTAPMPAKPVRVYMAGINQWKEFDAVPWAGKDSSRTFNLTSNGKANTSSGDGKLVETAPASAGTDTFTYDPKNPVISHGGEISGVGTDQEDGSFDQREIEKGQDVLVYTSEPLSGDLAVFGYIETELSVSSSAPDTDFTVKLVDVAPDGTAWNIADSIQRMRYRDGEDKQVFMKPGETYRVSPPQMLAANVFLKGHRIRLEVSSSNFPSYARNLNTAKDPYTSTEVQVATNKVLHGGASVSKIVLPVVTLPGVDLPK
ncbi:MAG TPA: CocE/NonD family hydrolase [Hyphomonadaceae bacterium]|nr:CocE/NonD family hydrolase [Hyphomonadaceae bacterium]